MARRIWASIEIVEREWPSGVRASAQGLFATVSFGVAAAIALADDEVTEEENALVNQLAEWFGITAERADAILDQLEEDA